MSYETNIPYAGANIMLDTDHLLLQYKDALGFFFSRHHGNQETHDFNTKFVFDQTLMSLVRIMHEHPSDVMDRIKSFPRLQDIQTVVSDQYTFIDPGELAAICEQFIMSLYMHLRLQLNPPANLNSYISSPTSFGRDYIMVTEVLSHPIGAPAPNATYHSFNHRPHGT